MTAREILAWFAGRMPSAVFTLYYYHPQTGAARRAIAEGADPARILTDPGPPDRSILWGGDPSAILPTVGDGCVLALGSRVLIPDRHSARLLLLDFAVPCSPEAQTETAACLRACGWRGWLLCSGASYHFIGRDLMGFGEWTKAMAQALLIPGIDVRYMGHSLHRSSGAVRLTTCPLKPTESYVVEVLS